MPGCVYRVRGVPRRCGASVSAVPLQEAAGELGVSSITLRRWIAQGCPVARRGGRGRGNSTLIVPDAVKTWRDGETSGLSRQDFAGLIADAALAVIARYSPTTQTGSESRLLRAAVSAMAEEVNAGLRK